MIIAKLCLWQIQNEQVICPTWDNLIGRRISLSSSNAEHFDCQRKLAITMKTDYHKMRVLFYKFFELLLCCYLRIFWQLYICVCCLQSSVVCDVVLSMCFWFRRKAKGLGHYFEKPIPSVNSCRLDVFGPLYMYVSLAFVFDKYKHCKICYCRVILMVFCCLLYTSDAADE